MEQKKTSFDDLWEMEERRGLTSRLRDDFPHWRHRRRVRRTTMATVAVFVFVSVTYFNFNGVYSQRYDYVSCNRSVMPDRHWVDMASRILTIEAL